MNKIKIRKETERETKIWFEGFGYGLLVGLVCLIVFILEVIYWK